MKKPLNHYAFLTGLCLFILVACQNNDRPSERITGLWNFQIIEDFDCMEEEMNNTTNFGNASCVEIDDQLNCLNGTTNFLNGTVTNTYNFLVDGILDERIIESGTYELSSQDENQLTICFDSKCMIGLISFTDSSMSFSGMTDTCSHRFIAFK